MPIYSKDPYRFYVYAYLRNNGIPYYIGKGQDTRCYEKHGRIRLPSNPSLIVFLEKNLSEVGAFALERRYIRWYGRKGIDANGVLLNLAEGGEGSSGYIPSKERRMQISNQMKGNTWNVGRKHSEESNQSRSKKLKGRTITEEHRSKISKALTDRKFSIEWKSKISQAKQGCKGRPHSEEWKQNLRNKKWWTDGINSVHSLICPEGFWRGRTVPSRRKIVKQLQPL